MDWNGLGDGHGEGRGDEIGPHVVEEGELFGTKTKDETLPGCVCVGAGDDGIETTGSRRGPFEVHIT